MTTNAALDFFLGFAPDDIVYALSHPEYFGLTNEENCELHGLVFKAIEAAQKKEY